MIHFKYGIHDFEFELNYYHELQYETQLLQVYDVSIINFILYLLIGKLKLVIRRNMIQFIEIITIYFRVVTHNE